MQKYWEGHKSAVPKKQREPACLARPREPGKGLRCRGWEWEARSGRTLSTRVTNMGLHLGAGKPGRVGRVLVHIEILGLKLRLGTGGGLPSGRRSWEREGDSLGHGSGCHMATKAVLEKPPDWSSSCVFHLVDGRAGKAEQREQ